MCFNIEKERRKNEKKEKNTPSPTFRRKGIF
jgi:hypothetical protein